MGRRKGIKVVAQRSDWDCGIAAMAMLLPVSYADISATCRTRFPKVRKNGVAIYEMEETAELLGYKLARHYKKQGYLEGRTGILGVLGDKKDFPTGGHWVVLKDGTHIVDPTDSTIWSLTDYMQHHKARPVTLLTL